jgi:hypothetical protein
VEVMCSGMAVAEILMVVEVMYNGNVVVGI